MATSNDSGNSFGARAQLKVGGRDYRGLPPRRRYPTPTGCPTRSRCCSKTCSATRTASPSSPADIEALAGWDANAEPEQGDRLRPGPHPHAGLHRRAGRGRPGGHARRHGRPRRRPGQGQPAHPGRAGHRPLGHRRRVRHAATPSPATPSWSSSATRSATGSCAGARAPSTPSGSCRPTPASATRSTWSTWPGWSSRLRTAQAYPDTLLGTDSHTTMINGLGVLGWGVGGIEAEAAMLGQPVSMLIPRVVGFQLTGSLPEGSTATDLVLTVTEMLRQHGVVGKFVEFYGEGVATVPLANRATIGNMSPEYGSTCAIFPIDAETLRYLELTGRPAERIALVEAYAKEQGLWHDPSHRAGLLRAAHPGPVDRRAVSRRPGPTPGPGPPGRSPGEIPGGAEVLGQRPTRSPDPTGHARRRHPLRPRPRSRRHRRHHLVHQHVQPVGDAGRRPAGPQRRREGPVGQAVGQDHPGPGSKVVMDYYERAGLIPYLEKLGFDLVGFGCTTCIGNSGPLLAPISEAVSAGDLAVVSVLSGNRNFEGRISPDVPHELPGLSAARRRLRPGRLHGRRPGQRPARHGHGRPARLPPRHLAVARRGGRRWWSRRSSPRCSRRPTTRCTTGDERWQSLDVPAGRRLRVGRTSTYVRKPPYFDGMEMTPPPLADVRGARVLAKLGDSVTTDHISPAGNIRRDGPAGRWLVDGGVRAGGLQLLRLPARQPRGHDPGHLRQHPPAQPAGAGHRGRRDPPPARTGSRCRSTTRPSATRPTACPC